MLKVEQKKLVASISWLMVCISVLVELGGTEMAYGHLFAIPLPLNLSNLFPIGLPTLSLRKCLSFSDNAYSLQCLINTITSCSCSLSFSVTLSTKKHFISLAHITDFILKYSVFPVPKALAAAQRFLSSWHMVHAQLHYAK